MSEYLENDIAQSSINRRGIAASFFQRYSNMPSNIPLKECHMRGVSTMVGLFENGISGVLVESGIG